ncbi:MAG TPA: Hsp20/alpha crystallin family protein [Vicinamibacterales bacterium]|nr:Hsp20/alpha crystallin family protein [Vicinamibacterales bacterium]
MTLVQWRPVRDLASTEIDRLDRLFSGLYGEAFGQTWVPAVDIFETDGHEYVIKAELPAFNREDIHIAFEQNVLTIQGERGGESEAKPERFQRLERRHGSFTRAFTLPASVDGSRISASYKDGLLTIRLPQRDEARPKQIAIEG